MNKLKKFFKSKNFLVLILIACLSFLTIGYARYGSLVSFSGNTKLLPDGKLEVQNIMLTDSKNLLSSEEPEISLNSIYFNVTFQGEEERSYVTYTLDIVNNSSYDYTYHDFKLNANISSEEGNNSEYKFTITGISDGDIVRAKTSKTINATLELVADDLTKEYNVTGNTTFEGEQQESGSVYATIEVVDNDLTGENNNGHVKLKLINSYSKDLTFSISSTNTNFKVVNESGNTLANQEIKANSEGVYDVYLKISDNSMFTKTEVEDSLLVNCIGIGNISTDNFKLNVTTTKELDKTKPQIGEVTLTMNNEVGTADVTFSRVDTGGTSITNYTILLYDENDNLVNTYNAESAITEYHLTNLSAGTYYVKVYGTDEAGNSGAEDVDSASTTNQNCRMSNTVSMKWIFNVTFNTSNMRHTGESIANIGTTYQATLRANTNYSLPDSITITMNGTRLTTSAYSYSSDTGVVSIPNVNGDITIRAMADWSGICLVEGTKVRLADGSKKNIEDINYYNLLSVLSYDTGQLSKEYPIWIEKKGTTNSYQKTTFSDGSILKTVGYHGIFSKDLNRFISVDDPENFKVGTEVIKIDSSGNKYLVTVQKIEQINKKVNYTHVVSTRYYNIIANDFLTTDGNVALSNLYGFDKNIKWPSTREKIMQDRTNLYTYKELEFMPYYMFKGMRAEEAKVLEKYGLNLKVFAKYFKTNQLNEKMLLKVPEKNKKRVWLVTTSDDKVTSKNRNKFMIYEGDYYILKSPKNKKNFKYWYNTSDNKNYKVGEKIKINHGTYFEAIYN